MKQKNQDLYVFTMNSKDLNRIAYVTPRGHDNPKEIQRILRKRHYEDVARYVKQQGTLLPTAIVVGLEPEVKATPTGDPKMVVLQFPKEEGKFAYILDGQHRLRALQEPNVPPLDLPVVGLLDAPEGTRAKVFADINSKQEQVTDVLLLGLYKQIGDLSPDESALVDIVYALDEEADSPLKGYVKILPDDKGFWIRSPILTRFVRRAFVGTNLENASAAERTTVLKEYLKAVKELWPDAWGNNADYSLTGSAGLEIMLGAFSAAKDRVDLNSGSSYTRENFKKMMSGLPGADIEMSVGSGVVTVTLDWTKTAITPFSGGQKGRDALIGEIKKLLFNADLKEGATTKARKTTGRKPAPRKR
jgi:DGQHR domain-containing protein